uniref:S-protein homolog n=1 Tax=Nicotiana tabacum TaxID=4097 RepID=A0A1S3Y5S8_TOBAC
MIHNIQGCTFPLLRQHQVHVLNNLPVNSPKLELHCASGDDDLGYKYPAVGTDFNWEFCATKRTLFFCHFWWDGKDQAFDVFNDLYYCIHDGKGFVLEYTTKCQWKVQSDGFYLGYYDEDVGTIVYTKYRD